MQQLHLVGFTADNRGLIFSARKGSKSGGFVVPLDDALLERVDEIVARREAEEGGSRSNRPKSNLSPREIQARLRAGRTIAQVAREAGVEEEWVARWAAPIQAEQGQVVSRAQSLVFEKNRVGPSAVELGEAVRWNMADKGIVFTDAGWSGSWDAFHLRVDSWVVRFTYIHRKRTNQAEWEVDTRVGTLSSRNRAGTELGFVAPGRKRPKPPRSTLVNRVEPEPAPPTTKSAEPPAKPQPKKSAKRSRRATAKKRPATKRASAKKAPAKKAPAKRAATKRAVAKKARPKKPAARKAPAKRSVAKKPVVKRNARRSPAKKKKAAAARPTASRALAPKPPAARPRPASPPLTAERRAPSPPRAPIATRPQAAPAPSAVKRPSNQRRSPRQPARADASRPRAPRTQAPRLQAPRPQPLEDDSRTGREMESFPRPAARTPIRIDSGVPRREAAAPIIRADRAAEGRAEAGRADETANAGTGAAQNGGRQGRFRFRRGRTR